METKTVIEKIRAFFEHEHQKGKLVKKYQMDADYSTFLAQSKIEVGLDKYKEIILQEETGLELGGAKKNSFSLIYPVQNLDLINHGAISLLGKEVNLISEKSIDFSIVILIGVSGKQDFDLYKLKQLSFISNSIEGFMIRSVPRKFWCRVSSGILKKGFSFEFLGKSIIHLYQLKFGSVIKSVEIFFINSYPNSINSLREISSEILINNRKNWTTKIEKWKKNIDCEYDWGCEICPYRHECQYFKELLAERNQMED